MNQTTCFDAPLPPEIGEALMEEFKKRATERIMLKLSQDMREPFTVYPPTFEVQPCTTPLWGETLHATVKVTRPGGTYIIEDPIFPEPRTSIEDLFHNLGKLIAIFIPF